MFWLQRQDLTLGKQAESFLPPNLCTYASFCLQHNLSLPHPIPTDNDQEREAQLQTARREEKSDRNPCRPKQDTGEALPYLPLDIVTGIQYLELGLPSGGHEGSHLKEQADRLRMTVWKDEKKLCS